MQRLPLLDPDYPEIEQSCDDMPDRCDKCPLYKVRCIGCAESQRRDLDGGMYCFQGNCNTGCNTCGGTPQHQVPTVCCKSPHLRAIFPDLPKWGVKGAKNDLQGYHKVKPLSMAIKGINMNQGSPGSVATDPYPPETECVAVSIRHIWTPTKGFVAGDLKRHMKIPQHVKLLVVTTTKDDVLEELWAQGVHGQQFADVNVDYWTPIMFSNYNTKGNMSNFFDSLRSYRSLKIGQGHFTPLIWFSSLMYEDLAVEAALSVRNVYFNGQFLTSDAAIKRHIGLALYWHYLLPKDIAFCIGGPSAARVILSYRKYMPDRDVYFVSVNPWMSAFRGKTYTAQGKVEQDYTVDRKQLIWHNQRNFFKLCGVKVPSDSITYEEQKWLDQIKENASQNAQKMGLRIP